MSTSKDNWLRCKSSTDAKTKDFLGASNPIHDLKIAQGKENLWCIRFLRTLLQRGTGSATDILDTQHRARSKHKGPSSHAPPPLGPSKQRQGTDLSLSKLRDPNSHLEETQHHWDKLSRCDCKVLLQIPFLFGGLGWSGACVIVGYAASTVLTWLPKLHSLPCVNTDAIQAKAAQPGFWTVVYVTFLQ